MRDILVVTAGRSDYGIYRSVLERVRAQPELSYRLLVTGGHLSASSGRTVDEIERDGHPIAARIALPDTQHDAGVVGTAMAAALAGAAELFATQKPDILLVLGDRFEMFAVTAAAVPFNIPIAHIHGGELSFGAIDDVLRHAITKMAHLHFPATEEYGSRIIRMGEEPWRVTVAGAPARISWSGSA